MTAPGRPERLAPSAGVVLAARGALWALVVIGSLGGVVAAFRSPAGSTPGEAASSDVTPSHVAGFAELAIRRWVAGDDEGPSLGPGSSPPPSAADASVVTAAAAVAGRQVSEGYWAVTVAVEVDRPIHGSAQWFFEIGVLETPDGLLASGAPAVVPAPVRADVGVAAGRALATPGPDDPIAAAAQAFLEALLAGRGDVARYLAPGVRMAPVIPAFDAVRVLRTADVDSSARRRVVRVEALATSGEHRFSVGYQLSLELRAGRWEVRRLSGAPTLRRPPASPAPSSTTAAVVTVPTPSAPAVPGA